jgi:hypothetical protein
MIGTLLGGSTTVIARVPPVDSRGQSHEMNIGIQDFTAPAHHRRELPYGSQRPFVVDVIHWQCQHQRVARVLIWLPRKGTLACAHRIVA